MRPRTGRTWKTGEPRQIWVDGTQLGWTTPDPHWTEPGGEGPSERAGGALRDQDPMASGCGRRVALHARATRRGGSGRGERPAQPTVTADMPSAVPAGRLWTFNDFFPRTVTVPDGIRPPVHRTRGSIRSRSSRPATRRSRTGRRTASAIDDTDDTALNPNGTTHAAFNIPALLPTCGPAPLPPCTFDGSSTISISPLGPPVPFDVHVSGRPRDLRLRLPDPRRHERHAQRRRG